MDMIYMAFAETIMPWVEDRFGRVAAVSAAIALVTLPVAGIVVAIFLIAK
ncbi:hypothetical protein [Sphingomonas sp. EC-HK361]|nr:hypothetical protein [Sphingomonas sp. EC-HK361]